METTLRPALRAPAPSPALAAKLRSLLPAPDYAAEAAALVADWPTLTPAQRDRLRTVFSPTVERLARERHAQISKPKPLTYSGVHYRLSKTYGPARTHSCIDCGDRADDWAYRGGAPDERHFKGSPYSEDLTFYDPRCRPCHGRHDKGKKGEVA